MANITCGIAACGSDEAYGGLSDEVHGGLKYRQQDNFSCLATFKNTACLAKCPETATNTASIAEVVADHFTMFTY